MKSSAPARCCFRIDSGRYRTALRSADAQLADARSQVGSQQADYSAAQARVQSAQAQLDYAVSEAARQKDLLGQGISSQDQYEQAALAVKTARQAISVAQSQAASIRAALSGRVDAPATDQPGVRHASAAVDDATLNLGYTVVKAPQDGIVTKVTQLQVGDYVTAGRPVFTLVGKHLWIEANFKESQLRYMRLGQKATVTIDAYPDHELRAHISSFSPGTGNAFSLLPPENATGNWVKVVQRLPVELELEDAPGDLPLHAGPQRRGHGRHRPQAPSLRLRQDRVRQMSAGAYPDTTTRRFITFSVMAATIMNALDSTIANVALPHIQGSGLGLAGRDYLGADQLYRLGGDLHAADWLAGRALRAQAADAGLGGRIHSCLDAVRPCHQSRRAGDLPHPAGHVRRGFGADEPGNPARYQSARAAWPRHGDLGHGRRARPHHWPRAGRLAHRQSLVALGVLHQSSCRHRDVPGHLRLPLGDEERQPVEPRSVRLRAARAWPRPAPVDARPRADAGLVQLHRDLGGSGHGGLLPLSLPRPYPDRQDQAVHRARPVRRPQFRAWLGLRLLPRRAALLGAGAAAADARAAHGLSRGG